MLYVKLALSGSGFTNQIFSLITGIILAIYNGSKIIFVDYFSNDYSKSSYTKISEIFNISNINDYLYLKYGVIIVDKYSNNFKFNYIKYGTKNKYYYLSCYEYPIHIKKNEQFNSLYGDPCPNIYKELIVNCSVYGYVINEIYPENLTTDLVIDFERCEYMSTFSWINTYNKDIFEDILTHIVFGNRFVIQSGSQIQYIYEMKNTISDKINVIHLRLEDDAIAHWSKMNNMTESCFQNSIETKYTELIKKYINKNDLTVVLTNSKKNCVFDFLHLEGYTFITLHKLYEDRELNAIIELLVSKICNNKFIGNFNFTKLNGSTFSYVISKMLNSNVEKITIDLDKIADSEQITK
jgi:hypothetical protein